MSKITYADKSAINVNAEIPSANKVEDTNMNDLKYAVNQIGAFNTATKGSNGDFYVTLKGTLSAGDIVSIYFPTATTNTATARLSVDGGNNYYNIKLLRGFSTVPASLIESGYRVFRFDGTNFIWINTNLVAYYKFTTAGTTTGAIPVDINADGGVYDIITIGKGLTSGSSNPGELLVYYNGDTTATNYYYQRLYISGTSMSAERNNRATGGYIYKLASLNKTTLVLSGIYPTLTTENTIISTAGSPEALNYMQYYTQSSANITSITFTTGNNMGVGTEIKIYKR